MSADTMIQSLAEEFRKDLRNKVFVGEDILLASVLEETGQKIDSDRLREVINAYLTGDLDSDAQDVYDAAAYACSSAAKVCFAENPDDEDEEVDYSISWIEDSDGDFSAEVRSQ